MLRLERKLGKRNLVREYQEVLARMLFLYRGRDELKEDELLGCLDDLWEAMSPEDHKKINLISSMLANDELTEEEFYYFTFTAGNAKIGDRVRSSSFVTSFHPISYATSSGSVDRYLANAGRQVRMPVSRTSAPVLALYASQG